MQSHLKVKLRFLIVYMTFNLAEEVQFWVNVQILLRNL